LPALAFIVASGCCHRFSLDDHHFQSALIHSVCRCKQAVPQIGALGWFRLWAEAQAALAAARLAKFTESNSGINWVQPKLCAARSCHTLHDHRSLLQRQQGLSRQDRRQNVRVRRLIAGSRQQGRAIGYLSVPISPAGGGYSPYNVKAAGVTAADVEARFGTRAVWILNPAAEGSKEGSAQPCVSPATLNACTTQKPAGCSAADSAHGLVNQLKRTVPPEGTPATLTFDTFSQLQSAAVELVDQSVEIPPAERDKIKSIETTEGTVGEGSRVRSVAFLSEGTPHPNTGESVNCNLKKERKRHSHIRNGNKRRQRV
jgi:hypothetical protein